MDLRDEIITELLLLIKSTKDKQMIEQAINIIKKYEEKTRNL